MYELQERELNKSVRICLLDNKWTCYLVPIAYFVCDVNIIKILFWIVCTDIKDLLWFRVSQIIMNNKVYCKHVNIQKEKLKIDRLVCFLQKSYKIIIINLTISIWWHLHKNIIVLYIQHTAILLKNSLNNIK